MAITVDRLINDERFSGDNVIQFLLYLPFGLVLLVIRIILALVLWIASIILPKKSSVRQLLSVLACCTFALLSVLSHSPGVYVKLKGKRDTRCSLLIANYVSALDSLAASHALGTISLRKWKLPPFFASSLGIKNAAQFVKKQHFAESPTKPVLLQPEGGPTSGRGLLRFNDWPFPVPSNQLVQPAAITVERMFTHVTVHRPSDSSLVFPWSDALWFLWTPATVFTITLLPPVTQDQTAASLARALNIEATDFTWDALHHAPPSRRAPAARRPGAGAAGGSAGGGGAGGGAREAQARQVKEVLPAVPMRDILNDLAQTKSVDVTITNFLEGLVPYTPESVEPEPGSSQPAPKYITPAPTGVFPKNARERQLSFQERKAQMIAEARQRYIDKHNLGAALNNC